MKQCPNGHDVSDEVKFCPTCGAQIVENGSKFCTKCGSEQNGNERFCTHCGTPFDVTDTQKSVTDTPKMQETSSEPIPCPKKPDNYMVWAILCTLLCCLPFGIVSIVYAAKVDGLYLAGDYQGAQEAADQARVYFTIGIGCGIAVYIICFFIGFADGFADGFMEGFIDAIK